MEESPVLNKIEGAVYLILLTVAACIITDSMLPFLTSEIIGGWDLTPQYYLYTKARESIRAGHITSYDPNWFAGYPAFRFYGFIVYFLPALFEVIFISFPASLLGFNLENNFIIFNLFIFSFPFLFLYALTYSSFQLYGRTSVRYSLLFGFYFLISQSDPHMAPFSIYSAIYHGHLAAFFTCILIVLLIGNLELLKNDGSLKRIIITSLIFSLIILSHTLSAVFALYLIAGFLIGDYKRKYLQSILYVCTSAAVITSFWTIPFILNFSLSSSHAISEHRVSSLHWLFPDLWILRRLKDFSIISVLYFPWVGIIFIIFTISGLISLIKKQQLSPALSFFLAALFLSGNFLLETTGLPLHYYRFVLLLFPLMILIAIAGVFRFYELLNANRNFIFKRTAHSLLLTVFTMATVNLTVRNYALEILPAEIYEKYRSQAASISDEKKLPVIAKAKPVSEFPFYEDAQKLLEYLKNTDLKGRIAVESGSSAEAMLGSVHFFNTLLPMNGIPVALGLLAESSLSAPFLIPLVSKQSSSLLWAKKIFPEWNYPAGQDNSLLAEDIISRMRRYNIEYILTTSLKYPAFLNNAPEKLFSEVKSFGPFKLYRLNGNSGLVTLKSSKPVLYVNLEENSFRNFSEWWWKYNRSLKYTLIHTNLRFDQIPEKERMQMGAFIINMPAGVIPTEEKISLFTKYKVPVYIISTEFPGGVYQNNLKYIKKDRRLMKTLLKNLAYDVPDDSSETAIPYTAQEDKYINFEANGGCLIKLSYFPNWKSENLLQTVYYAAPSLMYVFSDGHSGLQYKN